MMSILLSQFDKMNCKLDKLSSDVSKVKSSLEEQNNKFDAKFDEQKNCFDDKLNEMNAKLIQQLDERINAVSYTHLDVYKRQVLVSCICISLLRFSTSFLVLLLHSSILLSKFSFCNG